MIYVDNLRMVYGGTVELHKLHMSEQKCNMDTHKLGVVEFLDKYEVKFCDEYVVACLDEGVLVCLDNNNEDDFDVDFILAYLLEQLLEKTLGGKCLVHHGYMQKIGQYETFVHLCYQHNY